MVIPARNEVGSIAETVQRTARELRQADIDYEILVVDDASTDGTAAAVMAVAEPMIRRSALPARTSRPGLGMRSAPALISTPAMRWRS